MFYTRADNSELTVLQIIDLKLRTFTFILVLTKYDSYIVLVKMFSCWFLPIFNGNIQGENDAELTVKMHKIKV